MASAELLLFLPALSQPSTVHYGLIPNGLTRFASNSLNEPENASQLACAANEAVDTARVRIPARNHAARVRCESCPTGASGPRTQSKPHLRHCMDRVWRQAFHHPRGQQLHRRRLLTESAAQVSRRQPNT